MARALVLLAALLLALPGLFVAAKGIAAMRRRSIVVQGRPMEGRPARAAGLVLALYGAVMVGIAAVLVAALLARR
jgi:hypothetical protein